MQNAGILGFGNGILKHAVHKELNHYACSGGNYTNMKTFSLSQNYKKKKKKKGRRRKISTLRTKKIKKIK